MRHRKHTFRVGRRSGHIKSLLANQVSSLILDGRIETTVTKAKEARRLADRMVTLGKSGTLHHRRLAISRLHNVTAVHKLFAEIAPGFMERAGGYTRIIRLGTRTGDAAETCYLEWVEPGVPGQAPQPKPAAEPAAKAVEAAAAPVVAEEAAVEAAPATEDKKDA